MQQEISYNELSEKIHGHDGHVFFVSGKTFELANISRRLSLGNHTSYVRFSDFTENPSLEDLIKAKDAFVKCDSTLIIAIGGGSAIDLAKLVKYYAKTSLDGNEIAPPKVIDIGSIELVVIPSTFGTGSESTHFAVLYINGQKHSVAHESILPDIYLLDGSLSDTLPRKVKGSACLDALSQAVESYWSVASTMESKRFAKEAIIIIRKNLSKYLLGDVSVSNELSIAANLAGKAINITKTTAAHALSYTLTAKYNIPHGHAVALCIKNMFEANMGSATRDGLVDLKILMNELYSFLNVSNGKEASDLFSDYMIAAGLEPCLSGCVSLSEAETENLINSVNTERLSNHPVNFSMDEIKLIFD
ncbi:phosphonoacetaldehyde reductase [Aliivibrio kagoshimensis]|uniref:phosphonoacetaldehyde reductase n=1 Tax=Aliivibrio kagoshimensis TaxID=2910230 RepID=UPI003D0EECE4